MHPIPSIQQAVWQAADELMSQGQRPTVASVREITRRGSAGTINDALKVWWENLAERLSNRIPQPEVPEPVVELTRQLWERALEHGEKAFEQLRTDALEQVRVAGEDRHDALSALEQSGLRYQELEQRYAALEAGERDMLARLSSETALRQELEVRLESRQQAFNELDQARGQLEKELALLAAQYRNVELEQQRQSDSLTRQLTEQREHYEAVLRMQQQGLEDSEGRLALTEMQLMETQTLLRLEQQRLASLQEENTRLKIESRHPLSKRDNLKARLRRV
ncbi:MAG: DNA-binding protein [Fluviicoccus sp.]|uniref:DNA-binding protein n=1 Tax=Fluviicoccus sp. TaxID=2003552 RepID=UPI0027254694|nr:DNA-binding protein [Fluviicoccus sp.]MDO8329245.1 DNA-binding protein [Fluviicoccus sp.]